ncbi:hypothetical protein BHE74_00021610 [Ensete ventricosum]|nr:hypothetical protein GW17_00020586 [Ensete ventricosum]RWW70710.1 hypothetical protein BHE74_00021610 [Ensete ventricosum]RZS02722.1 hypothetical protein BHM03_00032804 [Ensete ventricosum]
MFVNTGYEEPKKVNAFLHIKQRMFSFTEAVPDGLQDRLNTVLQDRLCGTLAHNFCGTCILLYMLSGQPHSE